MNLLNPVLSFLFPVVCSCCSRIVANGYNGAACESCWTETSLFKKLDIKCQKCGRPHFSGSSDVITYCRVCDDDFYDLARSCGSYHAALRATVLSVKRIPHLSRRPIDILFDCYVREPFKGIDLIIPVPLSKQRKIERGFNQAEVAARGLSKKAGIPVDCLSLLRNKHSKVSRAALDRKGRALTVRNAFDVRRASLVKQKNILLIDDVFTTGATVSMAAKALKKAGVARVEVLTLARAGIGWSSQKESPG